MNRKQIEKRLDDIYSCLYDKNKDEAFAHLIKFVRDLALEVSELHPEELTLEDTRVVEEEQRAYERDKTTRRERDKLARELVEAVLANQGMVSTKILNLATQLEIKFNATKE